MNATESITVKALQDAGIDCGLWEKGTMRRIYINDLPGVLGLVTDRYKTGNICHAELNGETISNSQARKLAFRLDGKLYYDLTAGRWGSRYLEPEDVDALVSAIETRLEQER